LARNEEDESGFFFLTIRQLTRTIYFNGDPGFGLQNGIIRSTSISCGCLVLTAPANHPYLVLKGQDYGRYQLGFQ
jgi:hypothetical protein